MSRRRAVFFDIGETLVERPDVGPGRRLATALGLGDDAARAITQLVFRTAFESPAALADRLQLDFGLAGDPRAAVTAIWNAQLEEPCEIPGASACVAAVHTAGARIGVISNIWAPYAEGFRRACPGIVPLVESWHLSFEVGTPKPDPAIFHGALAALEVAATDALMVGDSLEKDVVPALALGMSAVWLQRDNPEPFVAVDALTNRGLVARNLAEVRRIVLTWLWAAHSAGPLLTAPLVTERSPA